MARCNPYGFGTDAGPRHLMGGMYGPEYAGAQCVDASGVHGVAVCEAAATRRVRMVCGAGHARGPIMDLCDYHMRWIRSHYLETCTACVWPDAAKDLNAQMDTVMRRMTAAAGDWAAQARLRSRLNDLRANMDELVAAGVIRKRPLRLEEVS